MARLHHANVITVFDATTIDGRDVIAMELIAGKTMASWLSRPRPRDAVVAALVAAGRGLAVAHAAAWSTATSSHTTCWSRPAAASWSPISASRARRDQRSCADLDGEYRPLVTLDSALTVPGRVLGTPAYMAPEQLAGGAIDARADQFAFCATAWEALRRAASIRGRDRGRKYPRRSRPAARRGARAAPAAAESSSAASRPTPPSAGRRSTRCSTRCCAHGGGPAGFAFALAAAAAIAAIATGVLVLGRAPWRPRTIALPAFEEDSDGPAISPDGTQIALQLGFASARGRSGIPGRAARRRVARAHACRRRFSGTAVDARRQCTAAHALG